MVGMWTVEPASETPEELVQATGADLVVTSLRQAVRQIQEGEPESLQIAAEPRTTAA